MSELNKSYRIRTEVGGINSKETTPVVNVQLSQTYDMLEILSLKLSTKDTYKYYNSSYGVIVGRVIANGGFGVPNAKISIFIERDIEDSASQSLLYGYTSPTSYDTNGIRYNLLPDMVDEACHQNIGTFPNKRLVLDNDDIIEVFEKYWKYTTTTNNSGDYMLFGIPTGNQQIHMDLDLSDCGALSQRPRDLIAKGYNANLFDSPTKFKKSTSLNSLAQVYTQDRGIYVYPYWGEESDSSETIAITRCDINVEYKFEPYAVFMGSVVTDKGGNAIGKNCVGTEGLGKMSDLAAGEGSIEMIRKTPDGLVEQHQIRGDRLIDGDGVWCYPVPMNLDYVRTDEFGNLVPTEDPSKGIPTRARVRFRFTMDESISDKTARKRCRYLVPNNPRLTNDLYPDFCKTKEADYEFGTNTREESYCDMFWNNVYTVKNYIPKLQKTTKESNRKHTGIKLINHYGDNNPMPYNSMTIKLSFLFRLICVLTKFIIEMVGILNVILSTFSMVPCAFVYALKDIKKKLSITVILKPLAQLLIDPLIKVFSGMVLRCVKISKEFCDDGINHNVYYPGCIGCSWDKSEEDCIKNESTQEFQAACIRNTDQLMTCIENQLAQTFDATSFNFGNDWVNGVLYFPLWYRRIIPKKKFFFSMFTRRAKDEWCDAEKYFKDLMLYQSCSVDLEKVENNILNLQGDNIQEYYQMKEGIGNKKKIKKLHEKKNYMKGQYGLIVDRQTMLDQTVYYYKSVEYHHSLNDVVKEEESNGCVKLMFATDIVLLGTLNDHDRHGLPQFYKELESTTFNMPTDIVFNDVDNEYRMDNEGKYHLSSTSKTEMSGCDWGNENEYGLKDSGLFYGIGCSTIEMMPKSCINLQRICELGVSVDQTKSIYNLTNLSNGNLTLSDSDRLVADGYISFDEIYNSDARAMFATLNGNKLRTQQNNTNGLYEYVFRHLYPNNFDGSLRSVMEANFKGYEEKVTYRNNVNLEDTNFDYYLFRMGDKPYFYQMGLDEDGKANDNVRVFPRYENSFYFYFGLKQGKTALDKFNSLYSSPCESIESGGAQVSVYTHANSWCSEISGMYDGYAIFNFHEIEMPYYIQLDATNTSKGNFSYTSEPLNNEKVYFGVIPSDKLSEFSEYDNVDANILLPNGDYTLTVADNEGEISTFTFSLTAKKLIYRSDVVDFHVDKTYLDQFFQDPNSGGINYGEVADDKDNLSDDDREIGGLILISRLMDGDGEPLENYRITINPLDDSNNHRTLKNYTSFVIEKTDGQETTAGNGFLKTITDVDGFSNYVVGVPIDGRYMITITMLCKSEGSWVDTFNYIEEIVTVNMPPPFKLYINEIDYDMINKKFLSGWSIEGTVNEKDTIKPNISNNESFEGWLNFCALKKTYQSPKLSIKYTNDGNTEVADIVWTDHNILENTGVFTLPGGETFTIVEPLLKIIGNGKEYKIKSNTNNELVFNIKGVEYKLAATESDNYWEYTFDIVNENGVKIEVYYIGHPWFIIFDVYDENNKKFVDVENNSEFEIDGKKYRITQSPIRVSNANGDDFPVDDDMKFEVDSKKYRILYTNETVNVLDEKGNMIDTYSCATLDINGAKYTVTYSNGMTEMYDSNNNAISVTYDSIDKNNYVIINGTKYIISITDGAIKIYDVNLKEINTDKYYKCTIDKIEYKIETTKGNYSVLDETGQELTLSDLQHLGFNVYPTTYHISQARGEYEIQNNQGGMFSLYNSADFEINNKNYRIVNINGDFIICDESGDECNLVSIAEFTLGSNTYIVSEEKGEFTITDKTNNNIISVNNNSYAEVEIDDSTYKITKSGDKFKISYVENGNNVTSLTTEKFTAKNGRIYKITENDYGRFQIFDNTDTELPTQMYSEFDLEGTDYQIAKKGWYFEVYYIDSTNTPHTIKAGYYSTVEIDQTTYSLHESGFTFVLYDDTNPQNLIKVNLIYHSEFSLGNTTYLLYEGENNDYISATIDGVTYDFIPHDPRVDVAFVSEDGTNASDSLIDWDKGEGYSLSDFGFNTNNPDKEVFMMALRKRREFITNIKFAFWFYLPDLEYPKKVKLKVVSDKFPIAYKIIHRSEIYDEDTLEKVVEYKDRLSATADEDFYVDEILIPTISCCGNDKKTDTTNNVETTACFTHVCGNCNGSYQYKIPYFVAIVNGKGQTRPIAVGENNAGIKPNSDGGYLLRGKVKDYFGTHLVEKRLSMDNVKSWSAIPNSTIPRYHIEIGERYFYVWIIDGFCYGYVRNGILPIKEFSMDGVENLEYMTVNQETDLPTRRYICAPQTFVVYSSNDLGCFYFNDSEANLALIHKDNHLTLDYRKYELTVTDESGTYTKEIRADMHIVVSSDPLTGDISEESYCWNRTSNGGRTCTLLKKTICVKAENCGDATFVKYYLYKQTESGCRYDSGKWELKSKEVWECYPLYDNTRTYYTEGSRSPKPVFAPDVILDDVNLSGDYKCISVSEDVLVDDPVKFNISTEGEFFGYFIVAETDKGCRAISPMYYYGMGDYLKSSNYNKHSMEYKTDVRLVRWKDGNDNEKYSLGIAVYDETCNNYVNKHPFDISILTNDVQNSVSLVNWKGYSIGKNATNNSAEISFSGIENASVEIDGTTYTFQEPIVTDGIFIYKIGKHIDLDCIAPFIDETLKYKQNPNDPDEYDVTVKWDGGSVDIISIPLTTQKGFILNGVTYTLNAGKNGYYSVTQGGYEYWIVDNSFNINGITFNIDATSIKWAVGSEKIKENLFSTDSKIFVINTDTDGNYIDVSWKCINPKGEEEIASDGTFTIDYKYDMRIEDGKVYCDFVYWIDNNTFIIDDVKYTISGSKVSWEDRTIDMETPITSNRFTIDGIKYTIDWNENKVKWKNNGEALIDTNNIFTIDGIDYTISGDMVKWEEFLPGGEVDINGNEFTLYGIKYTIEPLEVKCHAELIIPSDCVIEVGTYSLTIDEYEGIVKWQNNKTSGKAVIDTTDNSFYVDDIKYTINGNTVNYENESATLIEKGLILGNILYKVELESDGRIKNVIQYDNNKTIDIIPNSFTIGDTLYVFDTDTTSNSIKSVLIYKNQKRTFDVNDMQFIIDGKTYKISYESLLNPNDPIPIQISNGVFKIGSITYTIDWPYVRWAGTKQIKPYRIVIGEDSPIIQYIRDLFANFDSFYNPFFDSNYISNISNDLDGLAIVSVLDVVGVRHNYVDYVKLVDLTIGQDAEIIAQQPSGFEAWEDSWWTKEYSGQS